MYVKYWYCKVANPATIAPVEVRFVGLALDLLEFSEKRIFELGEFSNLNLPKIMRGQALKGFSNACWWQKTKSCPVSSRQPNKIPRSRVQPGDFTLRFLLL